jgi:hypothetical protein
MKKLNVNLCPMLYIDGSGDDGYQQDVGIHRREDGQASQVAGRQRQGQVGSPSPCLPPPHLFFFLSFIWTDPLIRNFGIGGFKPQI